MNMVMKKDRCSSCGSLISADHQWCPTCYNPTPQGISNQPKKNRMSITNSLKSPFITCQEIEVGIEQLPHAVGLDLPTYAHKGDSGFDLRAAIPPGETLVLECMSHLYVPTGIRFSLPKHFEIQLRPRSGLARHNGVFCNFGTIDEPYTGESGVILYNLGPQHFVIRRGDKLAQGVIAPVYTAKWVSFVDKITDRGDKGFGSSGVSN
jgi:dUTP pyrophosphatase